MADIFLENASGTLERRDQNGNLLNTITNSFDDFDTNPNFVAVINGNTVEFYDFDGTLSNSYTDTDFDAHDNIYMSEDKNDAYTFGDASTNGHRVIRVSEFGGIQWKSGGSFGDTVSDVGFQPFVTYALSEDDTIYELDDDGGGSVLNSRDIGVTKGNIIVGMSPTGSDIIVTGDKLTSTGATDDSKVIKLSKDLSTKKIEKNLHIIKGQFFSYSTARKINSDEFVVLETTFPFLNLQSQISRMKADFRLVDSLNKANPLTNKGEERLEVKDIQVDDNEHLYVFTETLDVYNDKFQSLNQANILAGSIGVAPVRVEGSATYSVLKESEHRVNLQFSDKNGNYEISEKIEKGQTSNLLPILNEPEFVEEINGGQGNLKLELAADYAEVQDTLKNFELDRIEVLEVDNNLDDSGRLIYRGFLRNTVFSGDENGFTTVTLNYGGYPYVLTQVYTFDNNGNTTFSYTDTEIADIFRDIVNFTSNRNDLRGGNFSTSFVNDTGTKIDFEVREETPLNAIQRLIKFAPQNWYWFVDEFGFFTLQETSFNFIDHRFVYGRELRGYEYDKGNDQIINSLIFRGGDTGNGRLFKLYQRQSSIDTFGISEKLVADGRVTKTSSADIFAEQILNERASPVRTISGTLLSFANYSYGKFGTNLSQIEPGNSIIVYDENVKTETTNWYGNIVDGVKNSQNSFVQITKDTTRSSTYKLENDFNDVTSFTSKLNTDKGVAFEVSSPQSLFTQSEGSNETYTPAGAAVDDEGSVYHTIKDGSNTEVRKINAAGKEQWTFALSEDDYSMDFDGEHLYVGSATKLTKLDKSGNKVWDITGLTGPVRAVAAQEHYDNVWFADDGDKVKNANIITGTVDTTYTTADNSNVFSLATGFNNMAYAGKDNGDLEVILPDGQTQNFEVSPHTDRIAGLYKDGKSNVYTASHDNTAKSLDPFDGSTNWTFSGHSDNVTDVASHPDNANIYTVSFDGTVKELDTSGNEQQSFSIPTFNTTGAIKGYSLAVDEFVTTVLQEDPQDDNSEFLDKIFWDSEAKFKVENVVSDTEADVSPLNGFDSTVKSVNTNFEWFTLTPEGNFIWDLSFWNFDVNSGLGIGIRLERITKRLFDADFEASEAKLSINQTIKETRAQIDEQDSRNTPDQPS